MSKPKRNNSDPRVSVVMPAHDAEATIAEALGCLVTQDMCDFEVIVVDDGSTDSTAEVVREAVSGDTRFRYVWQECAGAASARNRGMSMARGEYLLFLDADDLFEKDLLLELHRAASSAGADVAICAADQFVDSPLLPTGKIGATCHLAPGFHTQEELAPKLFQSFTGAAWNKLFRRSFVEGLGLRFQDLHHSNDTYFVRVALAHVQKCASIDRVLVHYRVAGKKSLRDSCDEPLCDLLALDAVRERLSDDGLLVAGSPVLRSLDTFSVKQCLAHLDYYAIKSPEAASQFYDAYFGTYERRWGLDRKTWPYLRPMGQVLRRWLSRRAGPQGLAWACGRHPKQRSGAGRSRREQALLVVDLLVAGLSVRGSR